LFALQQAVFSYIALENGARKCV